MMKYLHIIYKTINFIFWAAGIYFIINYIPEKYRVLLFIPLILYTYLWLIIRDEKDNKKL